MRWRDGRTVFGLALPAFRSAGSRGFGGTAASAMRWTLQVVGGGTAGGTPDAPAAAAHAISDGAVGAAVFALRFASQSYLFNAPEAAQRALTARGVRVATKLRHVFLSGAPGWGRWGGLPGLLLTVADAVPAGRTLHVHGGDGVTHCLGSMRWFVYRGSVRVEVEEYPRHAPAAGSFDFEDENLRVKVVAAPPGPDAGHLPDASSADGALGAQYEQALLVFEELEKQCGSLDDGGGVPAAMGFVVTSPSDQPGPSPPSPAPGSKRKAHPGPSPEAHAYKKQVLSSMFSSSASDPLAPLPDSDYAGPARRSLARLPHHAPSRLALSYLILTPGIPGKFDPAKAKALGIKPGPLFGQLQRGTPVEIEGREVRPEEVIGPSRHGAVLLVVDVPDAGYLPGFAEELARKAAELDGALNGRAGWVDGANRLVIIHAAPREVVESDRYWDVMAAAAETIVGREASDRVMHLLFHSGTASDALEPPREPTVEEAVRRYSPTFAKAAGIAYRFSRIDGTVFPDPAELARTYPPVQPATAAPKRPAVIPALPLLELVVEPAPPKVDLANLPGPFADLRKEIDAEGAETWAADLPDLLPGYCGADDEPPFVEPADPDSQIEVWPLGTGSAVPSKYRNVSSTLVILPRPSAYGLLDPDAPDPRPTVLLDCGESTLGQIRRLLPHPASESAILNLRLVFLSHLHADHQLGLVGVLRERWRLHRLRGTPPEQVPKVLLVAPWKYRLFLDEYSDLEEPGSVREQVLFLESEALVDPACHGNDPQGANWRGWHGTAGWAPRSGHSPATIGPLFREHGIPLASFATVPVKHCAAAFAGTFATPRGFRVGFSGDCRPSMLFAAVARGCDVLVHEATFEDGMEDEAKAKRHCTVGEAVAIGQAMNARFLLLTHFSQRYPKAPPLPPPTPGMLVALAYDGLRIRMGSTDPARLDRLFGSREGRRVLDAMTDREEREEEAA
ncbi:hypothetical protein DFJ74DRAFT_684601 [Hyaloraphidium curvatum]|nr:hypothetical protein DFJ74DRAFT_684601 [Hyaloraphidium curvatum]